MMLRRPLLALIALVAMFALPACRNASLGPRMVRELEGARAWRTQLVHETGSAPADSVSPATLVALGYLERARLGLGSPFRLAHYALADARLADSLGTQVAWTIVAMTVDGDIYQPDWQALDSLGVTRAARAPGAEHGVLVARAIERAGDPRAGELAVRLAYRMAAAEGIIRGSALLPIARTAALARDRETARRDAVALLREAESGTQPAMDLLRTWRTTRRFEVERPASAPLSAEQEVAAIHEAERLRDDLRMLMRNERAPVLGIDRRREVAPFLSERLAARFSSLASVRRSPPQAPIAIAIEGHRRSLLGEQGRSSAEQLQRAHFVERALNEESLVAEFVRLGTAGGREPAQALLWAASSMRVYGQEEPWFPGSGGPSVGELKTRFGLAGVSYDADLPAEWRPYYTRMLHGALIDLNRVLPGFSARGVSVHFGRHPLRDAALAVHEPRSRTIFLPPTTGAGAIAHELAHDLDWQVSLRTNGRRGEYLTDVAVRERKGALAQRIENLSSATLRAPSAENGFRPPTPLRPTEVFARSVDWYVAAALGRMGRVNGYLTAVQDELLLGYASGLAPDASGVGAEAMISVLNEMTPLTLWGEAWFIDRYGRGRALGGYDLVRHVLDEWRAEQLSPKPFTGSMRPALSRIAMPGLASAPAGLRAPLAGETVSVCARTGHREQDQLASARGRLVRMTAESLARRVLVERGQSGARSPFAEARIQTIEQAPWDAAVTSARVDGVTGEVLSALRGREAARASIPALEPLSSPC